jgi:hypothetical protein
VKSTSPRTVFSDFALLLDRVNEAFFFDQKISPAERQRSITRISGRLGLPGAYAGTFAETDDERAAAAWTFTGENLGVNARRRHVLAEEACRVLRLLGGANAGEIAALAEADRRLSGQIARCRARLPDTPRGTFCCSFCTIGVWRNAAAGGVRDFATEIDQGIAHLRSFRDDVGSWRRYPFFYTLSALIELPLAAGKAELQHAAARCERLERALRAAPPYAARRREVLRRVLALV